MKFTYLWVDFFTVIVPFIFSFHPRLKFYRNFKPFFLANILATVCFIIWDIWFTGIGVWGFNPDYVSGIYFYKLPIEEILFFICIPFSCLFTYHCLSQFFEFKWKDKTEHVFVLILVTFLLTIGIYNYSKLYTSITFISLSILLLFLKFRLKIKWLGKLISVYAVLLLPFFIVNGILTGSGLEEPVVWYNNSENLGIRLFTIPFEDVFYGFELILLNVFLYEYIKNKYFN